MSGKRQTAGNTTDMGLPTLNLDSKTAVVIGGTSGIGLTIARGLAEAGADVVATGRRLELVQKVAQQIKAMGHRSLSVACDVGDHKSLEHLLQETCSALGKVDILVNCAGITPAQGRVGYQRR